MKIRVVRFGALSKTPLASLRQRLGVLTCAAEIAAMPSVRANVRSVRSALWDALHEDVENGFVKAAPGMVAVAHEDGHAVGWALSFHRDVGVSVMIYVDEARRRQGIGRRLVEAMREQEGPLVSFWMKAGHPFFDAVDVLPPTKEVSNGQA